MNPDEVSRVFKQFENMCVDLTHLEIPPGHKITHPLDHPDGSPV